VDLGVTSFLTDRSITPAALAREAEDRGFSSLFVPEHTHIPTSRRTPYPAGGELPEEYKRTLDPFVALTSAAAATSRLRLGTGIALMTEREPIVTAKAIASLDLLSGGRFVFGVGFGWNIEELADHGVDKRERRSVARERVLAMQRLWADDEASYAGDHVAFEPSWSWPKPVQRPGPPVWVGGAPGPTLFRHVAEYADGWMPIGGGGVRAALPDLQAAVEQAGRDPDAISVVPFAALPDRGKLDHYATLGITEVVAQLPSGPPDVVLPVLDRYAELIEP
jgi:probable F420-dependent oxidoreductase